MVKLHLLLINISLSICLAVKINNPGNCLKNSKGGTEERLLVEFVGAETGSKSFSRENQTFPQKKVFFDTYLIRSLTFSCKASAPTEWIFHFESAYNILDPKNVEIKKVRFEQSPYYFVSTVRMEFGQTHSVHEYWSNFTCRLINQTFMNASVSKTPCPRHSGHKHCFDMTGCLSTEPSEGFIPEIDCSGNTLKCKNLQVRQYYYEAELASFPCQNIEYCPYSPNLDCNEISMNITAGMDLIAMKNMPGVIGCNYEGVHYINGGIPYFSVPNYTHGKFYNSSKIYFKLKDALKSSSIIMVRPSIRGNHIFWENQVVQFECLATLSLFANGIEWTLQENNSERSLKISADNTKEDIERHRYVSKINITLKENVSSIICKGPVINSWDWKNDTFSLEVRASTFPKITEYRKEDKKSVILFHCRAVGDPVPEIEWFHNDISIENSIFWKKSASTIMGNEIYSELKFSSESFKEFHETINCIASNFKGEVAVSFQVDLGSTEVNVSTIVGILAAVLILIGLVASILGFKYKHRKMRLLTHREMTEFKHGNRYTTKKIDEETEVMEEALLQPYNEEYELQKTNVKIFGTEILGKGTFGVAFRGKLIDGECLVAIKTPGENCTATGLKMILSEIKIMIHVGKHVNVVTIIGACTANAHLGDVLLVAELCENGSLEVYLTKHFNDGNTDPYSESSVSPAETMEQLLVWSYQIASGMEHISSKKITHADLATRNVLLTSALVAKITDFGLSRHLYNYKTYAKLNENEPLPWRWMALESLTFLKFSSKSDVWSYGVTLWEMFTLGRTPYPGINWTTDFVAKLEQGFRLHKPANATLQIYEMMLKCWLLNADKRPNFTQLKTFFKELLYENTSSIYTSMNENGNDSVTTNIPEQEEVERAPDSFLMQILPSKTLFP